MQRGGGVKPEELSGIFLTHIHIDHCVELPAVVFARYLAGVVNEEGGRSSAFPVYGTPDVVCFCAKLFGEGEIYGFASEMMKGLRGTGIEVAAYGAEDEVVYDEGGLVVRTFRVVHDDLVRTVALRFEYEGKVVTFSGDTEFCPGIIEAARGADLFVAECSFPEGMRIKGHITPDELARVAVEAGCERMVANHISTPWMGREGGLEEIMRREGYEGAVEMGWDLMEVVV